MSDDVVERRPTVLKRYGRGAQVVHATGRPPATRYAAAAETGTAAQRRGRRHEEIAFGRRPGRRRLAERDVAQARGRRRVGGRRRREEPFVGRRTGRREQAARPAFLDRGHGQRTVTVTATTAAATAPATVTAERRRGGGRGARHPALGHGGHRGRADRHGQHGPAGPGGAALVLNQRLDVGRRLGLPRPAGHQRAVAAGQLGRAARARQRAAASEHGVLPRSDLQGPMRRLYRLENGRRFQATVHVELGERRAVL